MGLSILRARRFCSMRTGCFAQTGRLSSGRPVFHRSLGAAADGRAGASRGCFRLLGRTCRVRYRTRAAIRCMPIGFAVRGWSRQCGGVNASSPGGAAGSALRPDILDPDRHVLRQGADRGLGNGLGTKAVGKAGVDRRAVEERGNKYVEFADVTRGKAIEPAMV